jgi:DNA-binding MarR family transcriptional regulator
MGFFLLKKIDRLSAIDASVANLGETFGASANQKGLLMRLGRALDQSMTTLLEKIISPHGLSEDELYTMIYLRYLEHGQSTPSSLRELVGKSPANMTRILTALEKKNFISRRSDSEDGRMSRVALSEAGLRKLRKTLPEATRTLDMSLSGLTEAEMKQLERLLRKAIMSVDSAADKLSRPEK